MRMGVRDASDINTVLFWIRDHRGVSADEVLDAGRRLAGQAIEQMPGGMKPDLFAVPERLPQTDVDQQDATDRWTRQIWSVSQRDRMIISLAEDLREIVGEVRAAAGLPELTW